MKLQASGWFGAQLGGTIWILIAAAAVWVLDAPEFIDLIGIFLAANLIGFGLWSYRHKVKPLLALELLIVTVALAGLLSVYILDKAQLFMRIQVGGQVSAQSTYIIIVAISLSLMLLFYWQNRK